MLAHFRFSRSFKKRRGFRATDVMVAMYLLGLCGMDAAMGQARALHRSRGLAEGTDVAHAVFVSLQAFRLCSWAQPLGQLFRFFPRWGRNFFHWEAVCQAAARLAAEAPPRHGASVGRASILGFSAAKFLLRVSPAKRFQGLCQG